MARKMKLIKSHKIILSIACIGFLITGWYMMIREKQQNAPSTYVIGKGSMMECAYAVGKVTAARAYQLKSGVTGKIRTLFVREGDFVEKGASLAELETVFTAPFSGTVTSVSCHEGETVFAASNILELTDLFDRHVTAVLDQKSALRICPGQIARLSFEALRDRTFEGRVAAVYPSDNKFRVRIDISDLPPQILPGMIVDAAIEIKEHSDVCLVPLNAIDKDRVIVKKDGKLLPVTIQIGVSDGMMAEAKSSDLKEGDEVLIPTKTAGQ